MIKCPYCGADVEIDYNSDIEATLWNFHGNEGDVEMSIYCEDCEEIFVAVVHYEMRPVSSKVYKN